MFMRNLAYLAIIIVVFATAIPAFAADGLITKPSAHSVDVTIEKFEVAAKRRGSSSSRVWIMPPRPSRLL